MAKGKGTSPYKKHNKKPCKYSELYNQWHAATLSGNTALAARLSKQHSERYLGILEDQRIAA